MQLDDVRKAQSTSGGVRTSLAVVLVLVTLTGEHEALLNDVADANYTHASRNMTEDAAQCMTSERPAKNSFCVISDCH